ncbi:hypothetical protein HZA33_02635 [Candidatus Pacearchaeota archaeon]|nr:hypothetical protein [Candidatus Pacearchaeota archaeon]
MSLEDSILKLSTELSKKRYVHTVTDPAIKQALLQNSRWINDTGERTENYVFDDGERRIRARGNYVFSDEDGRIRTRVALIGEKEIRQLREIFYKNVPENIKFALDELNIKTFEGLYSLYKNDIPKFLDGVNKADKEDIVQLDLEGQIGYLVVDSSYFYTSNPKELFMFGQRYFDKYLEEKAHSGEKNEYSQRGIKIIKKNPFTQHFLEFVFRLPEEDKNEQANVEIIKQFSHLINTSDIIFGFYENRREDRKFMDYFEASNEEAKKTLLNMINSLQQHEFNDEINEQLFKRGYQAPVKIVRLYEQNPSDFMRYFSKVHTLERKKILDTLFELPKERINPEISRWLSENYAELVEEVGRNKIPEYHGGRK